MIAVLLIALAGTAFTQATVAIWPFKQKRFVAEAFIDAGSLGVEEVTGRVIALGDWDGDQKWII